MGSIKKIKDAISGAGETLSNWGYVVKSNELRKKKRKELIDKTTNKRFKQTYGTAEANKANESDVLFNRAAYKKKKMRKEQDNKYGYLK